MSRRRKMAGTMSGEASRSFLLAAKALLGVLAMLLFVTPWTEGYRLLDNFPNGQDSEANILALLAFLGIVLLMTRSVRRKLRSMLLLRTWFRLCLPPGVASESTLELSTSPIDVEAPPLIFPAGAFNQPLQI